jgi:hypothetical protein
MVHNVTAVAEVPRRNYKLIITQAPRQFNVHAKKRGIWAERSGAGNRLLLAVNCRNK